ncbi:hypothetical protein AK830_g1657 [Neonectria ditissima]|uniref:DUF7779 domain-containing protein n=1 Tax=Neonectria ditissima TaxID=78410 RepID=A0A0P7BWK0_9HYPO|nr:hypothetical protein AK830_g1657 [Neonectria ditissima]
MVEIRSSSPLWHQASEKYREELPAAEDYQDIQKVHNLEELISSFSSIQGAAPNSYAGVLSLSRIAPRLKFVDDFSAVLALCFGADAALTAAVWGSIRLILSHASSAAETLQDVLDMLEELSLTLPRFQVYEQTLPLNHQLQQALLDQPPSGHEEERMANFSKRLFADNHANKAHVVETIANGLGLLGTDEEVKDVAAAIYKMKVWMATTKSTYLVIFDNADDLTVLKTAWPRTIGGSVLVTTRDFTVATSLVAKHVSVDALGDEDGSKMLLKALDLDHVSPDDEQHALAISKTFGGLPLALTQIGGFIKQRKMALREFLPLYERYSSKIDARKAPGSDYEHTLSTVWNVSFERLTETSTRLLDLLSFFDPDGISEDIFLKGSQNLNDEFSFLSDEMDIGDASEELLRAALINREGDLAILSIHRLVQSAVQKRLSESDNIKYFDAVVHMLCWGFPDHSSTDIGHQIAAWTRCEKCLPHVNHLVQLARLRGKNSGDRQKYADLLLRCGWYLYEIEMYIVAKGMVEQAISTFEDKASLEYASAIDLGGLIDLDLAQPAKALEPFMRALEIRKASLGPEDPFIAYSLNNVALAYTEMGVLDLAFNAHEEAIRLRLKANSDRIGNSYSNMSSLLLRMGLPNEAEEMLARCPSLKDFTDETFLGTGNPRFSGDMVLLSRIRRSQGRTTDALRLASKALAFRRKLLGNRLKTCDSQYDVASMLLKGGHRKGIDAESDTEAGS